MRRVAPSCHWKDKIVIVRGFISGADDGRVQREPPDTWLLRELREQGWQVPQLPAVCAGARALGLIVCLVAVEC